MKQLRNKEVNRNWQREICHCQGNGEPHPESPTDAAHQVWVSFQLAETHLKGTVQLLAAQQTLVNKSFPEAQQKISRIIKEHL